MSTLYTYGCSFTDYHWDTWADHMGKNFDKFINYGQVGAGNQYILHKLTESLARKEITSQDTVAIMWSTVVRYDYWIKGQWVTQGNIFKGWHDYGEFKNTADPMGFFMRDCSFIHAAKVMLDSIGCRYVFFSLNPLWDPVEDKRFSWLNKFFKDDIVDQYKILYNESLSIIKPSVYEIIFNFNWDSRVNDLGPNADDKYGIMKGADWPAREDFNLETLKNLDKDLQNEIVKFLKGISIEDVIDRKLYSEGVVVDYHPTPEMHREYLDAVLPDWQSWH